MLTIALVSWWAPWGGDAATAPPAPSAPASVAAAGARDDASPEPGARDAAAHARIGVAAASAAPVAPALATGIVGRLVQRGAPLPGVEVEPVRFGRDARAGDPVRTDADGAFVLPLPSGRFELCCRGANVPRGFRVRGVMIALAQRFALGDVEVPAPAAVTGRVVDERGGAVADALVLVSGPGLAPVQVGDDPERTPDAAWTRSDGGGRFRIGELGPGKFMVVAEHPALSWNSTDVQLAGGDVRDCGELLLRAWPALRGSIVNVAGAPIAGAVVVPGGRYRTSQLQHRRAARSDTNGAFVLPSFGRSGDVTVFADGCEPLVVEVAGDIEVPAVGFGVEVGAAPARAPDAVPHAPLHLVLQPAHAVTGRVAGWRGPGGGVRVDEVWATRRSWPAWVHDVLAQDHTVAADGSFTIAPLPAGTWEIRATAADGAATAPATVEVPRTAPVELQLGDEPRRELVVRVVDDVGAPVVGADIVARTPAELPAPTPYDVPERWFDGAVAARAATGADGHATLQLFGDRALQLAARSPLHLAGSFVAPANAVPATASLVLTRGAMLTGHVRGAELGDHARLAVAVARPGPRGEVLQRSPVDRTGAFAFARLPAGAAAVRVEVCDGSGENDALPLAAPVPWLGGNGSNGPPVHVDLVPGTTQVVELATPVPGELTGRVLANGAPLPGAIVFARRAPGADVVDRRPTSRDLHEGAPHTIAGPDGGYRFLVGGGGEWELRVRHPAGGPWSAPIAVELAGDGERRTRDLELAFASIRGAWPAAGLRPDERRLLTAQLYPLADASADPHWYVDWVMALSWSAPEQPLDANGGFVFAAVPAGDWVVRIVFSSLSGTTRAQRIVRVAPGEALDLGALAPPAHAAVLRTGCRDGVTAALTQLAANDREVFVRNVTAAAATFALGPLDAGRYRLRVPTTMVAAFHGTDPRAAAVDVEVHADGRVTPDVVWPDGVR